MPLSRQTKSRAQLLDLLRDILATDPGFYVLQCAPWDTPAAGYHRDGSWHITPSRAEGLAADLNWKDPDTGSRYRELEMLQRAALMALERGFSITFPLTPEDNRAGLPVNHTGPDLHCHIDAGSYSNLGKMTPNKGGAVTVAIVGMAVGYLLAHIVDLKPAQRIVGVTADGIDGPKTQAAVGLAQQILGVTADGKWGAGTQAAWDDFYDGKLGPATIRAWQVNAGTTADGKIDKPSSLIRKVQRARGVKDDGVLGPVTWKAIQKHLGVTADGVPGPKTIRSLQLAIIRGEF